MRAWLVFQVLASSEMQQFCVTCCWHLSGHLTTVHLSLYLFRWACTINAPATAPTTSPLLSSVEPFLTSTPDPTHLARAAQLCPPSPWPHTVADHRRGHQVYPQVGAA